jgi:hypothetical protein
MKEILLTKDTSMVSEAAVAYAVKLSAKGMDRLLVMYETNKAYGYSKGTMESYFGKLGAKAKGRKKEAELALTPSFI